MAVFMVDHQHQLPTSALAGFTRANTDAYTNFVASIMLNPFQLSVEGQRHVTASLGNLPLFNAIDDNLGFGWGDDIMRSKYMQRQGYEHISVMIALSATFHEPYSAEILREIARLTAGPGDILPHVKQWKELLKIGNGAFASYDFDTTVEDFIRMDPYCIGPGSNLLARRCRVPPEAMAKGLVAMSKLTKGDEKQVVLMGGAVVGWFAAFAEYFYNLKVALMSSTGEQLHGCPLTNNPQLILIYHQDPDLEVLDKPVFSDRDVFEPDDPAYSAHVHFLPFGGRVPWQSLLPKVFGKAFHYLDHEHAQAFATAIGGAARALEGEVAGVSDNTTSPKSQANPASYGAGLIQTITAWLSDLRRGQGRMERVLRHTPQEAVAKYWEALDTLTKICHCHVCSFDEAQPNQQPKNGYCLPTIVETVVSLGLQVSKIIVARNLFPSREGVQGLYDSQVQRRLEARRLNCPPRSNECFTILYGNDWNAPDSQRLQNIIRLFTGRKPEKNIPTESLVGISHEGICAYMVQLEKPETVSSRVRPTDIGLIRVVSGSILGHQKRYYRISTQPVFSEDEDEQWSWEALTFDHRETPLYFR